MKIGIDITPVIFSGSGIGTYTKQLVRHLLPRAPKDHFVLFASTLRSKKKLIEFTETISQFKNFTTKFFYLPPLITETIWNKFHIRPIETFIGNVDVFHAWDWQQPPAKTAKLVTTIHDLTTLKFANQHHPKTVAVHKRRLYWVKKEANAIIADSNATKRDIINLLGIDKRKIHTIYLGVGQEFVSFQKQPQTIKNKEIIKIKRKYNISGDYILSVGTREPRKNLNRAIEAFISLKNPHITLVIAGRYGWGRKIQSQIKAQNSRVKVLGFVEQQNLPALYAGAKAFVYPSLYEGFGLPVVEAMSIGCPVITSNKGSLMEVSGQAAMTVDPKKTNSIAAGIKTVLENPNTFIKNGIDQAKQFCWQQTAKQTLQAYKSLV